LVFKETGKQITTPTRTQVYVRAGKKWLMAANLVGRVRYGLSVD